MANPQHVVKRVGHQYEVVDQKAMERPHGMAFIAGGALAVLMGLRRRGLKRLLFIGGGTYSIYHGVTESALERRNQSPRDRRGCRHRPFQTPRDSVDQASMESFPASDSPGY